MTSQSLFEASACGEEACMLVSAGSLSAARRRGVASRPSDTNGSYKRVRRVKSRCEWLANGEWRAMEIRRDAIELQSRFKDSDDGNEGRE